MLSLHAQHGCKHFAVSELLACLILLLAGADDSTSLVNADTSIQTICCCSYHLGERRKKDPPSEAGFQGSGNPRFGTIVGSAPFWHQRLTEAGGSGNPAAATMFPAPKKPCFSKEGFCTRVSVTCTSGTREAVIPAPWKPCCRKGGLAIRVPEACAAGNQGSGNALSVRPLAAVVFLIQKHACSTAASSRHG